VELALLVPALVYLGAVLARRGWGVVRAEAGAHTVLAGLALFAAYGLALSALRLAPPASVAAVRESSVVMATVLGFVVLHERVGPARLLGSLSVLAGVCVLALA
jgi:drug/metabolite transporter (DMT)-like permease